MKESDKSTEYMSTAFWQNDVSDFLIAVEFFKIII